MATTPLMPLPVARRDDDEDEQGLDIDVSGDPLSEEDELKENEDGSVDVPLKKLDDKDPTSVPKDFFDNLADGLLGDDVLGPVATDLLDLIEKDERARKKRDELYAEGIKRTGAGKEAPGGADFEGAARTVHPLMMEAAIDFAARTMKEIFPANGPVKSQIVGESTDEKLDKADRKRQYMNWQLTKQITEFRGTLEKMLSQEPLAGSMYLTFYYDELLERPRVEMGGPDEVIVPFACTDFYSTHRYARRQRITQQTYEHRVASRMYRELPLPASGTPDDPSAAAQATMAVEGKEEVEVFDVDGLRTVYEVTVDWDFEGADPLAPTGAKARRVSYIIHIDESSRQVLGVYRNWDPEEDKFQKLHWTVEFPFVPWRGAQAIGLVHIIGSLAAASTGTLRALLDAAHRANNAGILKLKGNRTSGQSQKVGDDEITEIEGPTNCDDIRKLAMTIPFPQPSSTLVQLLEMITVMGKGVVGTTEETIRDVNKDVPVGTTLAMIEQGSITYSSIHGRQHAAMAMCLQILHRINKLTVDDEETIEELGNLVVTREDFQGPMDVIPVSDPNIFSDTQRYAQLQAVVQLAGLFPNLYRPDKLNVRALRLLKFPDFEEVLTTPPEPKKLDSVTENVVAATGKQPLKAYPDQDHFAHLQNHVHFMASPIYGANPLMAAPALPMLVQHCREHIIMLYEQNVRGAAAAVQHLSMQYRMPISEEKAAVQGAAIADQELARMLAPLMPLLLQAQQMAQKVSQPPVLPEHQVQMAKVTGDQQIKTQELQQRGQEMQANMALAARQQQFTEMLESRRDQFAELRSQLEMQAAARDSNLASQTEMFQSRLDAAMDQLRTQMEGNIRLAVADKEGQVALLLEEMKQTGESFRTAMAQLEQQKTDEAAARQSTPAAADSNVSSFAPILTSLIDKLDGQHKAMAEMMQRQQQTRPRRKRIEYGTDGMPSAIVSEDDTPPGAATPPTT